MPTPDLPGEEWRPIPGHEAYAASNLGRVKRIAPPKNGGRGACAVGRVLTGARFARAGVGCDIRVKLVIANGKRLFPIQRLVLAAFVGPLPDGKEVNHIDGNPENNCLTNLEYCTRSENHIHRCRILHHGQGESHGCAKLTDAKIREIRERLSHGDAKRAIARSFGIDQKTVYDISRGKIWSHVV